MYIKGRDDVFAFTYTQSTIVAMETFTWGIIHIHTSMETIPLEVEWKCVLMAPTIQCVMRVGMTAMLLLSVTT